MSVLNPMATFPFTDKEPSIVYTKAVPASAAAAVTSQLPARVRLTVTWTTSRTTEPLQTAPATFAPIPVNRPRVRKFLDPLAVLCLPPTPMEMAKAAKRANAPRDNEFLEEVFAASKKRRTRLPYICSDVAKVATLQDNE